MDERHKSTPMGLVDEARSRMSDFDEVWVVYDKDGYTKHKEAYQKANEVVNGKKVNVAFSSIAFEHWVLLHFEKNEKAFDKSKDVVAQLNQKGYFRDYDKKSDSNIYPQLKARSLQALENAAWLRYKMDGDLQSKPLYAINPITYVDALVKRLLGVETEIIFGRLGHPTPLGQALRLSIDALSEREWEIRVENMRNTAIVLNELTFYWNGKAIPQKNRLIEPENILKIPLARPTSEPSNLSIEYKQHKAVFQLNPKA